MKNLIVVLCLLGQYAVAGNSSGTLGSSDKSSTRGGSGGGTTSQKSKLNGGILFYQGETQTNIYFKYGKAQGNSWEINQLKVNKNTDAIDLSVFNAIEKSKETKDWSRILQQSSKDLDFN